MNEEEEKPKTVSEAIKDLKQLFADQLKDIFWAEKALVTALPKMAENATAPELVTALNDHLAVTQHQLDRIEQIFDLIEAPAEAKKCAAMYGLIKEAQEIMEDTDKGPVRDMGIIAASQKIEHYEIASYCTLSAFAKLIGETDAADLLQRTLEEEREADARLTQIADDHINLEALEPDEEPI